MQSVEFIELDGSLATNSTANVEPTVGAIAIVITTLFFGFCYAPVKRVNTGDGVFFQWVMASSILMVGIFNQVILVGNSEFYPLNLLGGALWATGNICTVPIFKTLGMSMGILIWGMVNMLFGWASGRFGWFNIGAQVPSNVAMNYAGISIAMSSTLVYGFIRTSLTQNRQRQHAGGVTQISVMVDESIEVGHDHHRNSSDNSSQEDASSSSTNALNFLDRLSPSVKKIIGVCLSVFAGTNYGLTFVPSLYVQSNYPGASKRGSDYVLGNFLGIFLAATVYFVIYALCRRGRNLVPSSEMILPSILAGVLWGVAQSSWFIANEALSAAITFPIVATIPAVIATLLGICLFKEIQGMRNFVLLGGAYMLTTIGVILTALSR